MSLQGVPFTNLEARAAGLSASRIRGEDVLHSFQGVLSTEDSPDLVGRCHALAKKLPDYAFFCGPTAAKILGVPLPLAFDAEDVVHVGVPSGHRTLVGRGIRGHTYDLVERRIHAPTGLVITSPTRLWCELAAILNPVDLVVAGDHLIQWRSPLCDLAALRHAAQLNPAQRGRRALRWALPRLDERSESPQESRLRLILIDAGITGWTPNFPITTTDGYNYRADFAFPERRLILEYQSYLHEGQAKFRADMTRLSRLQADEWEGLLINADDIRNPRELAMRIRRVLARRPHF